ncbi:hypothetical protein SAMN05421686_101119 [Thalassolituus maritimus]|uniref:CD-NTase associated protein 4-like DNA endonuclease domain-containing protein n=1 Tax=Thalassolituus maritimus TaxID=484498 RepID=A0A1N7IXT3_9GAMM|nr:dsDNA nuclease domain-containing protein [Thalassolituus maritimus]SIS41895.1 hypothetical protein SAMN05421686_101119 [Thalassolituus maritimus]
MSEITNDTNSGVEALTGFSFQRNSAIFIVLDNYDFLVTHDFFICIEHHDDVIFSHLNDSNEVFKVDAYQAKKSTSEWATEKVLAEIIAKMTLVGHDLDKDIIDKSEDYSQGLTFLTNKSVKLNCGCKKKSEKKYSEIVRENNLVAFYSDLHSKIQGNILNNLKHFTYETSQLEKVSFRYIDIGNTDKAQQNQLIGMISDLFKDKVSDPSAALDLLLKLFRQVETVYNQGGTSKLLDESKRVYGKDILKAINVICSKSKAFKLWRDNAQELSEALRIPISKGRNYAEILNNCFDYFKDLKQVEFQKIYHFVNDNRDIDDLSYSDVSCIKKINEKFHQMHQTQLDKILVSFVIIAAYVETRNIVS